MTAKALANKFGKKVVIKLFPSLATALGLDYQDMSDLTDKTLEEVINQLDDFFEIYKYENDVLGNKAAIKATDLYLSQNLNKIHVGTTISNGLDGLTATGGKTLNEYLDIKDNHPIERINDLIQLKYNTTHFKTGASPKWDLELNDIMDKVEVKPNAPVKKDASKQLYLDYDIQEFKTSTSTSGYQLELNSVSANKIQLSTNDILKNSSGNLILDYDTNTLSKNTTFKLEVKTDGTKGITSNTNGIAMKADEPLYFDATGNISLRYDTNEFMKNVTTNTLELKDDGIKATKLKLTSSSLYSDTGSNLTVKLDQNGGLSQTSAGIKANLSASSGLQTDSTGLKINLPTTSGLSLGSDGLKVDLPTLSGLQMDATGLKINLSTINSGLVLATDGLGISTTYKLNYKP
jgi:hypothetical protein